MIKLALSLLLLGTPLCAETVHFCTILIIYPQPQNFFEETNFLTVCQGRGKNYSFLIPLQMSAGEILYFEDTLEEPKKGSRNPDLSAYFWIETFSSM